MKSLSDYMQTVIKQHQNEKVVSEYPSEEKVLASAKKMVSLGYLPLIPEAFQKLAIWAAGDRRKGLLLYGDAGTGKTLFMSKAVDRFVTAKAFVSEYKQTQDYNHEFWYNSIRIYDSNQQSIKCLGIDELGKEPKCKSYGEQEEVLDFVISERYEAWKRYGVITIITSNFQSPDEIDQRYGRRVTDRLRDMCVAVKFIGKSLRGAS